MTTPSAGILAAFGRPVLRPSRQLIGIARVGEDAEVLDGTGLDDVPGEQHPPGQHRAEAVEEHVQAAQSRTEEPGGRHPDLGIAGDHRDVGHQRHLESTAQCVTADLAHGDLGEAHEVVVEAKRLAVHRESASLARPRLA